MIVIALLLALRAASRPRARPRPTAPARARRVSFLVGVLGVVVVWSKPTFAIPLVVLLVARARTPPRRWSAPRWPSAISALVLPLLARRGRRVRRPRRLVAGLGPDHQPIGQSRLGSGLRIDAGNAFVRVTHLHPSEGVATVAGLLLLLAGAWLVAPAAPARSRR